MTHQLLAFSRRQHLRPEIISLDDFLETLLPLLKTTVGDNVSIKLVYDDNASQCLVDPVQFETAILNLVINARDAMNSGGSLTISVQNTSISKDSDALKAGEYVEVLIEDTGKGMSLDQLNQAFEPFFTTKDVGKGTGLGLSMVFGFLRQSNGQIDLSSEKGEGTKVRLLLPRANAPATTDIVSPVPLNHNQHAGKGEHILLLEDNDSLRLLTQRQLEKLGYKVSEAASHEAINRLLDTGTTFDLMLSDVLLPGTLKGPQIAEEVKARQPDIQLLFMSGYMENSQEIDVGKLLAGHFLPKPFRLHTLAEKLRSLLDS